ncbi:unnamed protein product [Somion occarium]|uniref:Homeobox domain-containing protein n=1 Tax=Somion occarium TaxID=3059160 RepID=A0ABP1DLP0_9APHY
MSHSDDHFHYGCFPRPARRNSPATGNNNPNSNPGSVRSRGLFGLGHGGRTVLPPLFRSSRSPAPDMFPANQYAQQEPTQGRTDYNLPTSSYGHSQWPSNTVQATHQSTSYPADPRYSIPQDQYSSSYPARGNTSISMDPHDARALPPIGSQPQGQYYNTSSNHPMASASHAPSSRSPIDQFPGQFTYNNPSAAYYPPDPRTLPPPVPSGSFNQIPGAAIPRRSSMSVDRTIPSRASIHGQVPYARDPHQLGPSYSHDRNEPLIKPKRKRATADQLKVLNQMYDRTAFPSTEERVALAKQLGMSPRSVQIWFQNKRQAQRTLNRQQEMSSSAPPPPPQPSNPYQSSSLYGAVPPGVYQPQPRPSTAQGHHMSGSPGYDPSPSPSSHSRGRSRDADRNNRRSPSRPR